jgi:CRISPR-associated endonuclease/helicase Cas3
MDHALAYGMRRIIYVIPYTSIIEQTAREFRFVFGTEAVLEHHSNFIREEDGQDDEAEERRRLAAENWDAPIVVTTNVQFFESFFANRSSRTRKLHNVARSVVILDEAQMLPVPVLRPTMEVIRELAERYGTSLVLCTATQPALAANDEFRNGLEGVREMMSAPLHLAQGFERVREALLGKTSDADIARLIQREERCLCIVNTKRHARLLFESVADAEGAFHLSAAMCPVHRSKTLGDPRDPAPGTIRRRLRDGDPCRVVSTQLVEAGVDVDFPVVIRALAGIDSIVQAAGRCNREGRIIAGGRLYVFVPQDELPVPQLRQNAQIATLVLRDGQARLLDPETVRAYFKELYWLKDGTGALDSKGIMSCFKASVTSGDFPFKTVAGLYCVIPDDQIPVVVPFDGMASELCAKLRYNTRPGAILRKLQPYTIQVYPRVLAGLREGGYAESLQDERYHVLTDLGMREAYDERFGLNPEMKEFLEVENLMI